MIGILAFWLLLKEQRRLDQLANEALQKQAQTVADNADLLVSDIKSEMMAVLTRGPARSNRFALQALQDENPMVDEVFMWTPAMGLLLPAPGTTAAQHYAAVLFTPRGWLWETEAQPVEPPQPGLPQASLSKPLPQAEDEAAQAAANKTPKAAAAPAPTASNYSNLKRARKQVRVWSQEAFSNQMQQEDKATIIRQENRLNPSFAFGDASKLDQLRTTDEAMARETVAGVMATDWQHLSINNQYQWLGYAHWTDGQVIGVSINMAALADNLTAALPDHVASNHYFGIYPPDQEALSKIGITSYAPLRSDLQHIAIGDELPGWTIGFHNNKPSGALFVLLGGVFTLILMAAILMAGSMLLLQAKRDQRDVALKTSFVSNVSHELKTPLTTIRMYAEMLADGLIDNPQKKTGYLTTLVTESERLTRLVNNVLDFSRLEQNKKTYQKTSIAIHDLVTTVVANQQLRLKQAELQTVFDFAATDIHVLSDRDAIEQVLLNLIDNTMKYASPGKLLKFITKKVEQRLHLIVEDRGPGIAKRDRQRIFGTFQRLDHSLTTTAGCGLGLSISLRLIEDLGGSLHCEAAHPHGARFIIALPL